uniref:cytochrome b n=1 Tax=Xenostrobus securis TaxID=1289581 RepID=UPI00226CAFCD|nr:cytochrome b [Xenostrobus securis]UZG66001.1 cytochrome b [Xenostrobus securis]
MFGPVRDSNKLLKAMNYALYDLPAPVNLSVWWNFGSLLGLCLVVQLFTGFLLSTHYTADVGMAFDSVIHIIRDVNMGWLLRGVHANGASMFFVCVYIHIGRGLYYGSYKYSAVWNIGVGLLLLLMGTAFLGYVLPWGQMSYWGCTVITSMVTAVPGVGQMIVEWVWGGYSVGNPTLMRFYSLHFILPFVMAAVSGLHLFFLHETGSNNPLGLKSDSMLIEFHPYYTSKDLVGFSVFMMVLMGLVCFYPDALMDSTNWIPADSLKTPAHIQPEWYFLFAYTILRAIPNKVGGILALLASVFVLVVIPTFHTGQFRSLGFYPLSQALFWALVAVWMGLTWIGTCDVSYPYDILGRVFTCGYFSLMVAYPVSMGVWDSLIE